MIPDVQWITPLYNFWSTCDHIGVPETARGILEQMASELVATTGLVAIYVPEGTDDSYNPGKKRGRVAGAVRLIKIPSGREMDDFFYEDWDGSRRWPIGWPCEVIYAPDDAQCPSLREHVEHLFGQGSFGGYVKRFQRGPFRLEPAMRERINRDFAAVTPLV